MSTRTKKGSFSSASNKSKSSKGGSSSQRNASKFNESHDMLNSAQGPQPLMDKLNTLMMMQSPDNSSSLLNSSSPMKDISKQSTFVWGKNSRGQLGEAAKMNEFVMDPLPLQLLFTIKKVACGSNHAIIVSS